MAKFLALALLVGSVAAVSSRGTGQAQSLLQTWSAALDGHKANSKAQETPLAQVVTLLKSMQETLEKEMDEDQKLYEKLKCWCEENAWNKGNEVEDAKTKIASLEASIESLTAKKEELEATIKEVTEKTKAEKEALAEAQSIRDKQLQEFHGMELDSIQAIEQLKAAIIVLGKHHQVEELVEGKPITLSQFGVSLLQKDEPWAESHARKQVGRALDDFMAKNEYFGIDQPARSGGKFLQSDASASGDASTPAGWSVQDTTTVRIALKTGMAFMQSHHKGQYYPSYTAQSGEILGILKQMKDEMSAELGEAQKLEAMRSEQFTEMRHAKTEEIEAGERMEEQKEDELATTANELAEAKEDLGQTQAILDELESFLKNMKETCEKADKNWEERKSARQAEMEAVAQTIEILTADEAKDAASGTYSFIQQKSASTNKAFKAERAKAATLLRKVALKTHSPQIAMLATTVELDAFEKVKAAIDDMIVMLKKQQEDEVKKQDWCKAEFKENEMTTLKTEDRKADLEAKIAELESTIKALTEEIAKAKDEVEQAQIALQSASLNRKAENMDYQKTVADQLVVIDVLKKALTRLAKYYEGGESLLQRSKKTLPTDDGSVAPVAQMEYKPSAGAAGVMQMLEKLGSEAKELMVESKAAENDAQKAYEETIAASNEHISDLLKTIATKTKVKAKTEKAKMQAEEDLTETVLELEGLAKYLAQLHVECDFLLHNFDTRQQSRGAEIEALQQAKQILNGAQLSSL